MNWPVASTARFLLFCGKCTIFESTQKETREDMNVHGRFCAQANGDQSRKGTFPRVAMAGRSYGDDMQNAPGLHGARKGPNYVGKCERPQVECGYEEMDEGPTTIS